MQTIERTAKRFKGAQLIGLLLFAAGVASCSGYQGILGEIGGAVAAIGIGLCLGARIGAWWYHG